MFLPLPFPPQHNPGVPRSETCDAANLNRPCFVTGHGFSRAAKPPKECGDDRDLAREKDRLTAIIDRFAAGGPAVCTPQPHAFFGKLTPQEWAILMYKHLDHHLRQFSS